MDLKMCNLHTWLSLRAGGQGFPPTNKKVSPQLLSWENRREMEPKEISSCLIPHLFVVSTQQLEILATALTLVTMNTFSQSPGTLL